MHSLVGFAQSQTRNRNHVLHPPDTPLQKQHVMPCVAMCEIDWLVKHGYTYNKEVLISGMDPGFELQCKPLGNLFWVQVL